MNAWVCDGCGAIRKDRAVGWLQVRPVVAKDETKSETVFSFGGGGLYGPALMFCSTDCIAAAFMLRGIEVDAKS